MRSQPLVASSAVIDGSGVSVGRGGATRVEAPAALVRLLKVLLCIGVATLLAGSFLAPERSAANLLLAAYYVLSLGLAGVLLIAIEYVTGAGWSVAFRRVPEAMAKTLPAGAALFLIVLALSHRLYPWLQEGHGGAGDATWFRDAWLTPSFFYIRSVFYLAVWIFFAHQIVARSRRQDDDGLIEHTRSNTRWSAAFLVVFGFTLWLASTDWIMSLEPHWYSTIFGVYHFAGLMLGGLAMTAIIAIWLEKLGATTRYSHARTSTRPRQAHLCVQHILDVHLVQPVHADLVRQFPGGNRLFHTTDGRLLGAGLLFELSIKLGNPLLRVAVGES